MKRALRYLRFSSDGQSQHSIERQDAITFQWCQFANIQVLDTFTDEGYTARNFDRPDIKQLFDFIQKNQGAIDYLVVSELTRFSREAGDAINMVKKIQFTYNVKIVSAGRGSIYDCSDHNSFFMMGLEFLLGNSENIKRQNDINGGIYAAKSKGRYIGARPPFGYTLEGHGRERKLVIDLDQAQIIRFIFSAYLRGTPYNEICRLARQMGYTGKGNSVIHDYVLANPVYAGMQQVKAYKNLPGGMFPANHEAIIDMVTWQATQKKLTKPERPKTTLSHDMPLRGVLKCHCGLLFSGSPCIKPNGKVYFYYKCDTSSHNHISAIKLHTQLEQVFGYLSLPNHLVNSIREKSENLLEQRMKEQGKQLLQARHNLEKINAQLHSVEEKFINNQMSADAYSRWHTDLTCKRLEANNTIEKISRAGQQTRMLLKTELQKLRDMKYVWQNADTLQKQELIRMLFDSRLYYQNHTYRTSYIMPVFTHNLLMLKEKRLLEVDAFDAKTGENPVRLSY